MTNDNETTESISSNLSNTLAHLLNTNNLPDKYQIVAMPTDLDAAGRFSNARHCLDLLPSRVLVKAQIDELERLWGNGDFNVVLDRIQSLRRSYSS
ncbi:hypothetical protein [Acidomonas methanolica]|uniref:hypothetical protein n=1 Tax=Acidomonas methanolica TaxID=437 RepID=UPI00211A4D03|nr:hypothetical protein [Acidomonas methanolica]MCQ9157242.1 hypothetical protein [Acidomonas methanolica]